MMELPAPPAPVKRGLPWTYNTQLVCRNCQVKGYVRTVRMLWENFAECQSCHTRWSLGRL